MEENVSPAGGGRGRICKILLLFLPIFSLFVSCNFNPVKEVQCIGFDDLKLNIDTNRLKKNLTFKNTNSDSVIVYKFEKIQSSKPYLCQAVFGMSSCDCEQLLIFKYYSENNQDSIRIELIFTNSKFGLYSIDLNNNFNIIEDEDVLLNDSSFKITFDEELYRLHKRYKYFKIKKLLPVEYVDNFGFKWELLN